MGFSHPGPALSDEGEVGRDGHGLGRPIAAHDVQVHVDGVGPCQRFRESRRGGGAGGRIGRRTEPIEGMGDAALGDVGGDVGEAGERVVPAVALEAGVGLEEPCIAYPRRRTRQKGAGQWLIAPA